MTRGSSDQVYLLDANDNLISPLSEDVLREVYTSVAEDQVRVDFINDNIGLLKPGDFPLGFNLENDNVGLLKTSDQPIETTASLEGETVKLENSGGTVIDPATKTVENILNALKSNDTDELISRITDPSGAEIDPRNVIETGGTTLTGADWVAILQAIEKALTSVGTDQLRADLINDNVGLFKTTDFTETRDLTSISGTTLTADDWTVLFQHMETLYEALGSQATDVLRVTSPSPLDVSGAEVDVDINSLSYGTLPTEQQTPVKVEDSGGATIDPAKETDFPNHTTVGHDLIGTGNLTIEVSLAKSQAVMISANSTDSNSFSVSVDWVDDSGNIYMSESKTDIDMGSITQDWARLTRKAPKIKITVTDESGGTSNNVNVFVDTHR